MTKRRASSLENQEKIIKNEKNLEKRSVVTRFTSAKNDLVVKEVM